MPIRDDVGYLHVIKGIPAATHTEWRAKVILQHNEKHPTFPSTGNCAIDLCILLRPSPAQRPVVEVRHFSIIDY